LFVVYGLLFIGKSCPEVLLEIKENRKMEGGKSAVSGFDGYSIVNITRQIGFIFST